MSNAHERRAPGMARMPFDAMVEVGGSLGPSFEAQAVNLSEDGMSLRTAYLPEVGQPVMCRFDAGQGLTVTAAGEVLWKDDMGNGGEFGIRFTNLDAASNAALGRILMAEEGQPSIEPGRKVRLHIDGLASPMRARVKDQLSNGVTAYSELGFLQMGKPLDLEDAQSGKRRPASIDRVEIAMDQASRIPQLVVSLRYDDMPAEEPAGLTPPDRALEIPAEEYAEEPSQMGPSTMHSEPPMHDASMHEPPVRTAEAHAFEHHGFEEHEPEGLKRTLKEGAAKLGPVILGFAKRAKTAAALLAAKARKKNAGDDVEVPLRRTTAPAPGGGLHASGRKVVRGSITDGFVMEDDPKAVEAGRFKITKKKAGVAASIVVAVLLVGIAMKKPATPTALASAAPTDSAAALSPDPEPVPTAAATALKPVAPRTDPLAAQATAMSAKPGKATPFTNGPVGAHPTVLKIKMDGPVDGIQGAAQPTGFTIVIPNRKSIEPTASLSDKDGRIASVNVTNEPTGAELSVNFKDGVPNYIVRSHGDTLELVLAKQSAHGDKTEAHAPTKKHHSGKKHEK